MFTFCITQPVAKEVKIFSFTELAPRPIQSSSRNVHYGGGRTLNFPPTDLFPLNNCAIALCAQVSLLFWNKRGLVNVLHPCGFNH